MKYPTEDNHFQLEHADMLNSSYRRLLGKDLIADVGNDEQFASALFYAPFAVVSHNTAAEPIFNYANLTALRLFAMDWDEFIQLPSKLSAEPVNQAERQRLLAEVTAKGYINNYQGVRIAKTGQRFLIKNAVVWNLVDDAGYQGQAACFAEWEFL
ncbi:MAG: MEKHLA domain-containing protein [Methylobacter sp.]|nr:MEKHLA domain-containing protein [Methylobacter sp.]